MGVMYLVQSYRLKHKLPPRPGFKLPSLEWLQRFNRESLLISTCLLFAGLVSGLVINLNQHGDRAVPWTDPVVVSSGVLFLWLTALTLFEYFYKPARQGRKVAYLTLASFLFLGLALGFVLFGEHARSKRQGDAPQSVGWTSRPSFGFGRTSATIPLSILLTDTRFSAEPGDEAADGRL
jgi:CDP-diglyceride synthetase